MPIGQVRRHLENDCLLVAGRRRLREDESVCAEENHWATFSEMPIAHDQLHYTDNSAGAQVS